MIYFCCEKRTADNTQNEDVETKARNQNCNGVDYNNTFSQQDKGTR
jgi:hypothetical protein